MGPGTGQKLRPLASKDVSLSVSWWLERLTTVWELLIIRDLRSLRLTCNYRFVKKSEWVPKPSKNVTLESFIENVKSDILRTAKVNTDTFDNLGCSSKLKI
jgi:hypothetical protein